MSTIFEWFQSDKSNIFIRGKYKAVTEKPDFLPGNFDCDGLAFPLTKIAGY